MTQPYQPLHFNMRRKGASPIIAPRRVGAAGGGTEGYPGQDEAGKGQGEAQKGTREDEAGKERGGHG